MDEVINAIRRAIIDEEEAGEMTSTSTSREEARVKPIPEAGLLSREATAAVGSAFNTLTETVKRHEPLLEDVVRETLRPILKSWLDENLPRVVERMVEAEDSRTLTIILAQLGSPQGCSLRSFRSGAAKADPRSGAKINRHSVLQGRG